MLKYFFSAVLMALCITQLNAQTTTATFTPNNDTYVYSETTPNNLTGSNYATDTKLLVGSWTNGGTPYLERSFIGFNLSSIPAGAVVCSAVLTMYTNSNNIASTTKPNSCYFIPVASSWTQTAVTWTTQPSLTTYSTSFGPVSNTVTAGTSYTVNLTSDVQRMVTSPSTNYGWAMILQNESLTSSYYSVLGISSSDYTVTANRPVLTVTYAPSLTVTPTSTVICAGKSTGITVSGATGYSWSPGGGLSSTTGASVTASPTVNTTYTITGTSGSCVSTATSTITVNAVPTLTVTPASAAICTGSNTTFTASGASTYTWAPATGLNVTTGASVTANPTVNITYTITGTNASACTNTLTNVLTVNALPSLTVTPSSGTICAGSNATFTAAGASTYTWSPNTGLSATTGASITANPTVNITYTITGTNASACINTKTASLTVNALPTLTVTPASAAICAGSNTTFTASGASTYNWSPNTGLSSTTGASVTANPTVNITYTITGTNASACVNTKTATLTVNALPTLSVTPTSSAICAGSNTTFTASGANTYTWSPATGLSASTGANITATPSLSTTYTLTGTNSSNCINTKTYSVTVNPVPSLTVNTATIYSALSATLTASGATTYTWSPAYGLSATTGSTVVASPSVTTTYTINGTTGSCSSTTTTTVNNLNLYFRSAQTGSWDNTTTWQSSPDSITWISSSYIPNYRSKTILIQATHTVTMVGSDTIDQVVVNGMLSYNNEVGSVFINDGSGTDLLINGTFQDGSVHDITWLTGSPTWALGSSGTMIRIRNNSANPWRDHYQGGIANIPATATWIVWKVTSLNPTMSSVNMYYPNLIIQNTSGLSWTTDTTASFRGTGAFPVVKGSLNIGGSGTSPLTFLNQNTNAPPLLVQGGLTIPSGATFQNNGTGLSIQGNISVSGTLTASKSIYVSGAATQTLSGTGVSEIARLTVNKTGGQLVLGQPLIIDTTLTLTAGNLVSTSTNSLSLAKSATVTAAGSSSFVSGPVTKIGNSAFTFPTGKGTNYQPLTISAPLNNTDAFTAEYFNTAQTLGSAKETYIGALSTCEFWNLGRPVGTSSVNVTLGWNTNSCNKDSADKMHIAFWNGTKWVTVGSTNQLGSTTTGSVTTDAPQNNFGSFMIINKYTLPLSITVQTQNILPGQLQNSGYIVASGTNGFPPYHYTWSDSTTTNSSRFNLPAGTYSLTVTDSLSNTANQTFALGTPVVALLTQNISIANNIYTNTSYSTGIGSVTFANSLDPSTNGWFQFPLADTVSTFFLGLQQTATDSTSQSITGLTIQTAAKYVSRAALVSNPALLATYDTIVSFYHDSIRVNAKTLHNTTGSTPVNGFSGISLVHNKLLVFVNGATNQKAISINPGDVLLIGRTSGAIYAQRNGQNLTVESSSGLTLSMAPKLHLNSTVFNAGNVITSFSHGKNPITPLACSGDLAQNFVYNQTYDASGTIISKTKTYYDGFGRTTQSQAALMSQNNTLVSQNLFDGMGRATGQTLPAPNFDNYMCYQSNFVTSSLSGHTNQVYSYIDFDMPNTTANSAGQTNNPSPVANSTQGTLGWYYSNNNTSEPYVAASGLPYNRVEYFPDPLGRPKKVAGVGEDHAMGSGHESSVYYMSNAGELDFFYGYHGTYELKPDFTAFNETNQNLSLFKTVTVNADGKEDVSYATSAGQTVASCISNGSGTCVTQTVIQPLKYYKNGSIDIHLPKSQNASLSFPIMVTTCPYQSASTSLCDEMVTALSSPNYNTNGLPAFRLLDMSNGYMLVAGTDYTLDLTSRKVTFLGSYLNKSLYLRLNYDFTWKYAFDYTQLPDIALQYNLDYTNWTLNYFDVKGHLISNVAPNDVNCLGQQVAVNTRSNTSVTLPVNGYYTNSGTPSDPIDYTNSGYPCSNGTGTPNIAVWTYNFPNSTLSNNSVANVECHLVNISNNTTASNLRTNGNLLSHTKSIPATIATPGLVDTLINTTDTATLRKATLNPQLYQSNGAVDTSVHIGPAAFNGNILLLDTTTRLGSMAKISGNIVITYSVTYQLLYQVGSTVTALPPFVFEFMIETGVVGPGGSAAVSPIVSAISPNLSQSFAFADPTVLKTITQFSLNAVDGGVSATGYPGLTSGAWYDFCPDDKLYGGWNSPGVPSSEYADWGYIKYAFLKYAGLQTTITINDFAVSANQHTLSKKYTYDKYNRLSSTINTDEGEKDFVYDAEDKLRFSQNDKQRLTGSGGKFTYINYDRAARPIETGEYDPTVPNPVVNGNIVDIDQYYFITEAQNDAGTTAPSSEVSIYAYPLTTIGSFDTYRTSQQTYSAYDLPDASLSTLITGYTPAFLPGKVAKTWNGYSSSWYSYDELGRLIWSVKQTNEGVLSNPVKTFNYTYNLQGNLLQTAFQKENSTEAFYHKFDYDADQRLTQASTSFDGSTWTLQDKYYYYLHGALKREEINTNLQGLDYVYTIGGMLKSINDPSLNTGYDPGTDGLTGSTHSSFKPDIFGFAIDYYTNDYLRANSNIQTYNSSSYSNTNNLYSGQIKSTRWQTQMPSAATNINYTGSTLMFEYNYDDLYRISGTTFGLFADNTGGTNNGNGQTTGSYQRSSTIQFTAKTDYLVSNISYDLNGNLKTLRRYANAPGYPNPALIMDDLTYNYVSGKPNRLAYVADASTAAALTHDIDIPNQTSTTNYTYNTIGQTTANAQEGTTTSYDVYGQVIEVDVTATGKHTARFVYNDKGLRAAKIVYDANGKKASQLNYMYDAAGSLVNTYQTTFSNPADSTVYTVKLNDYILYGASRLGIYDAANSTTTKIYDYEMNDHLGNVRAVYTKDATTGLADVVSFTDFYPHGSALPGRNYTSTGYRYNYQGQEKDAETGLLNFELRQMDPRIGRWFAPDPMHQDFSPYNAMGNNPVSMVDPNGGQWKPTTGDGWDISMDNYWAGEANGEGHAGGWNAMNPTDRTNYQDAVGTSYWAQNVERQINMLPSDASHSTMHGGYGTWEKSSTYGVAMGSNGSDVLNKDYGAFEIFHMGVSDGDISQLRKYQTGSLGYFLWGVADGVGNSIVGAYDFITKNAYKISTYKNALANSLSAIKHITQAEDIIANTQWQNSVFKSIENATPYDYGNAAGKVAVGVLATKGLGVAQEAIGGLSVSVYRVYGGGARSLGSSWSLVNPNIYGSAYRFFGGIPNANTMQFMVRGTTQINNINTLRPALPIFSEGSMGLGVPEVLLKDPGAVNVTGLGY